MGEQHGSWYQHQPKPFSSESAEPPDSIVRLLIEINTSWARLTIADNTAIHHRTRPRSAWRAWRACGIRFLATLGRMRRPRLQFFAALVDTLLTTPERCISLHKRQV
jgi:hypothetical protein